MLNGQQVKVSKEYSTLIGISGEHIFAKGYLGQDGFYYIAGITNSNTGTFNADSGNHIFITKIDTADNAIVFTKVFQEKVEVVSAITLDNFGNIFICGSTKCKNFPVTKNAFDTIFHGGQDIFLLELDKSGEKIIYSTLIGGAKDDDVTAMKTDKFGNIYLTGVTSSPDFPTTHGAFDETYNGGKDIFVLKLNIAENKLRYSTLLGSKGDETSNAMAVDSAGYVYLSGEVFNDGYPVTAGAFDTSYNGDVDMLLTKIDTSGRRLIYSTYLGGKGYEWPAGIAIDKQGCAYVSGASKSDDFPTTAGAYNKYFNGVQDIVVTKFSADGSKLVYSTFIGGKGKDSFCRIAINNEGMAFLTGYTQSVDFPVKNSADSLYKGGARDNFLTILNATGSEIEFSTFIGGNDEEGFMTDIIASETGIFILGTTRSSDFPVTNKECELNFKHNADNIYFLRYKYNFLDNKTRIRPNPSKTLK